jgi:hypothetical protein
MGLAYGFLDEGGGEHPLVLDRSIVILGEWLGKSWSTPRDQMHLARSISVLVRIITNNGWHTQPFKDTPNPLCLPLSAGDFSLPRVAPRAPPADLLTKRDPRLKLTLSPRPIVLPQRPQPIPPMLSVAHRPLGPSSPISALLPQDLFPRSPTPIPFTTSQPWLIWPRPCQICLLIAFL